MERQLEGGGSEVIPEERMYSAGLSDRGVDIMGTKVKGDGHYGNEGQRRQTLWERRSKGSDIMGTKVKWGGHYGNEGQSGRTLWERRDRHYGNEGQRGWRLQMMAGSMKEKGLSPKAILFTDGTQKFELSEDEISQCFILCLLTAR